MSILFCINLIKFKIIWLLDKRDLNLFGRGSKRREKTTNSFSEKFLSIFVLKKSSSMTGKICRCWSTARVRRSWVPTGSLYVTPRATAASFRRRRRTDNAPVLLLLPAAGRCLLPVPCASCQQYATLKKQWSGRAPVRRSESRSKSWFLAFSFALPPGRKPAGQ